MVKTIHDLCCKMFLERQTERALASHAAALHAVDMLAIDPPADGSASRSALHQSALAGPARPCLALPGPSRFRFRAPPRRRWPWWEHR